MILATPHLSELQGCLGPSALGPLLNVVQEFKPGVIGVEFLPPTILEEMERRGGDFNEMIEYFAKSPNPALTYASEKAEPDHRLRELLKIARS